MDKNLPPSRGQDFNAGMIEMSGRSF